MKLGAFKSVGDVTLRHVDLRLIAAANRDLAELVKEKAFRGDDRERRCRDRAWRISRVYRPKMSRRQFCILRSIL